MRRTQPSGTIRPPATYALLFLALFLIFQCLYQRGRATVVVRFLIEDLTVAPSAELISWLTPGEGVAAQGHRLVSPHARLSVLNGCEGAEVMLMLAAAVLASGMDRRRKALGIIVGGLLVYLVNQARIVALYYSLRVDRSLFETLHGYVAPIIVIAAAGLFVLYWMSHAEPRRPG